MFGWLKKIVGTAQDRKLRGYFRMVKKVNMWDEQYRGLSDEELRGKTAEFKERLK